MMLRVLNNWVDREVTETRFACDLSACKGACCTLPGGSGAPIDDDEISRLYEALPIVGKYLPRGHLNAINQNGMIEEHDGYFTLKCIDDRACVFVMYEGATAKCAIQHSYNHGELQWVKPRSCYLFPIRMSYGRETILRFEHFPECQPALRKGEEENISLDAFLEQPLRQEFGDGWYEQLQNKHTQMTPLSGSESGEKG